jgi:hypothetical protein
MQNPCASTKKAIIIINLRRLKNGRSYGFFYYSLQRRCCLAAVHPNDTQFTPEELKVMSLSLPQKIKTVEFFLTVLERHPNDVDLLLEHYVPLGFKAEVPL